MPSARASSPSVSRCAARTNGFGRNIRSTVHLEHVADLYRLALALAAPGIFMLVENGSVLDWIARELPRLAKR
ncbi:MAG TPA: hypothetical protein VN681_03615 [Stellaceae bacterium]|nr:hypothetical protein [Stellaceae bacterium]